MIDAPDRKAPRFPAAKAAVVGAKIADQLEQWKIGEHDLAICSGASGADILFAEESLRRGAHLRLLLAQEMDAFVRDSVQNAGNDWVQRFHTLVERAQVETLPPSSESDADPLSIYAQTNLWIINTARAEAGETAKLYALLVWDEKPTGDGPGGSSDFAERVRDLGGVVEIINPTTL
jgi:hypothetical protein